MKSNKENRGITLVALIITIIILLILSGVTIAQLTGNGLFGKAQLSKIYAREAQAEEKLKLKISEIQIEKLGIATIQEVLDEFKKDEEIDVIEVYTIPIATISCDIPSGAVKGILVVVNQYEEFTFTIGEQCTITKICGIDYSEWNGETINSVKQDNKTQVTLIYDANGGIGEPSSQTQYDNEEFKISSIKPTREGYMFKNWNTKEDGTGTSYNGRTKVRLTTSTTLYAQWDKITELSCLITTGNQYIDTGFIPNQDTTIEIQFLVLSDKTQFIFGNRIAQLQNTYSFLYTGSTYKKGKGFRSDYANEQIMINQENKGIQTIKKEKNKVYINGELKYTHEYSNFSTASTSENNKLVLFNNNTNGNIDNSFCAALKFYYCKIWDKDVLVRDFIPIIINENRICLYDKVEQKIYYEKYGSEEETFREETDITEISSARCEGNQYIDTNYKPNQDTTVEMKVKLNNSTVNQALFGARTTNLSKTFACFYIYATTALRFDYNTIHTSCGIENIDTAFTVKESKNKFYINGVQKGSTSNGTFSGDYNLYLFGVNTSGTVELKSYIDFYYCKIWDGDTLIRDYIPILDNENVICLYDKVNKEYYYSKGINFEMGM